MIFGYARVSTKDQSLDRQIDALKLAGCEEIYNLKNLHHEATTESIILNS